MCLWLLLLAGSAAIQFDVQPGSEKCFSEDIEQHELFVVKFNQEVRQELVRGEASRVTLTVTGPEGSVLYTSGDGQNGSKFAHAANAEGWHIFCFSNAEGERPCG